MNCVGYPEGWRIDLLSKTHNRKAFRSGQEAVDAWLKRSALHSQKKHISSTKMLLDDKDQVVGYYTLAASQVDFSDLPSDVAKSLPQRKLPVAVVAWLGVDERFQRQGIGRRLLATAPLDCYQASETFAFIAVILDCVDEAAKAFCERFDFSALPGDPMRLYLPFKLLQKIARG